MKQLTALFTASVFLFGLFTAAWAEEPAPEAEPAPVVQAAGSSDDSVPAAAGESVQTVPAGSPSDSVPSAEGTPQASQDAPDGGTTIPAGSTVPENSYGTVIHINNGTVDTNLGTVEINNGTVNTNAGIVENNSEYGTVQTNEGIVKANSGSILGNSPEGTVELNNNCVDDNKGTVEINQNSAIIFGNFGTVKTNDGLIYNSTGTIVNNQNSAENCGTVLVNNGHVFDGNKGKLPEVVFNLGDVKYSETPDEVAYNAGEVYRSSFNIEKDDFDRTTWYGVVYANEDGEGFLLPQALSEQILENAAEAKSILAGLVSSGDLVFTAAESDSVDPEKNGIIPLLSAGDLSFKKSGYSLSGWLDVRHNNASYAPGETVTVTAPLWLIPNWVLIPVPSPPAAVTAAQTGENGSFYLLVPSATGQTESWNLSSVTVTSPDPRVTQDGSLPAAALRLSAELADILRIWPLKVEFDGEILPYGSFSLSFHRDGTVTLLFSRTFLNTQPEGEHEVTLFLQETEIGVTILLTEPTSEETSLRARKDQLYGAFTTMPQSSAGSQKGKTG